MGDRPAFVAAALLCVLGHHVAADFTSPCPTPAGYNPATTYPVFNETVPYHPGGENYKNYCNHVVTPYCQGMCDDQYRRYCYSECDRHGFKAAQCRTDLNYIPASVEQYSEINMCTTLDNALAFCRTQCSRRGCTAYFYQERDDNLGCVSSPGGGTQYCGFYLGSSARDVTLARLDIHRPGSRLCYPVLSGRYTQEV